jgi:hypothetical protein
MFCGGLVNVWRISLRWALHRCQMRAGMHFHQTEAAQALPFSPLAYPAQVQALYSQLIAPKASAVESRQAQGSIFPAVSEFHQGGVLVLPGAALPPQAPGAASASRWTMQVRQAL